MSFGYLFQTDDIFELHATFESIGSGHLPLMLHLLKNQTNAVFRLEHATEVLELTYLGKYFACGNAN